MDGKSCARLLVIAGFTRIHAATDSHAAITGRHARRAMAVDVGACVASFLPRARRSDRQGPPWRRSLGHGCCRGPLFTEGGARTWMGCDLPSPRLQKVFHDRKKFAAACLGCGGKPA